MDPYENSSNYSPGFKIGPVPVVTIVPRFALPGWRSGERVRPGGCEF